MKVQDFWFPRRNESVSYVRLGGRATLTIDYDSYRDVTSTAGDTAKAESSSSQSR
jgi:hypothetical protein